jgi:prephenate dehydratase
MIEKRFSGQGIDLSYHDVAGRELFGKSARINPCDDFGKAIVGTRNETGIGVIAVKTAQGGVRRSLAEVVSEAPDAFPEVVGRVDMDVSLVLVSADDIGLEEVNPPVWTHRVLVHAHKEAWRQGLKGLRVLLKRPREVGSSDNIQAVKTIKELGKLSHVAITAAHAVEPLGVYQLGEGQLNPPGSKTRFYGLQLEPTEDHLVPNPAKTDKRAVVSVIHPDYHGAIDEVLEQIVERGLEPMDFIQFPDGGKFPKGGIFELAGDTHGPERASLMELCARLGHIKHAGKRHLFAGRILGGFDWYPGEESLDLDAFAVQYHQEAAATAKLPVWLPEAVQSFLPDFERP